MGKPRVLALLLGLLTILQLNGCGFGYVDLYNRIGSDPQAALADWPLTFRAGMGEQAVTLAELIKDSKDIVESPDRSYVAAIAPAPISTVSIGEALSTEAQASESIPPPSFPDTNPAPEIDPFTFTVDDLGIMQMSTGIPVDPAQPYGDQWSVQDVVDGNAVNPATGQIYDTMVMTVPFDTSRGATSSLIVKDQELRGAELAEGSEVVLEIANQIGGGDPKLPIELRNIHVISAGSDLNAMWRVANPVCKVVNGQAIHVGLDVGSYLAKNIVVTFDLHGEVQAGFKLNRLDAAQTVTVNARPSIQLSKISLEEQQLAPVNQTVPVDLPDDLGIKEVGDIRISSGSIVVHVENTFGVNTRLDVALGGVLDSRGASFSETVFIPGSKRGEQVVRDLPVSLDGAILTGAALRANHNQILVTITSKTVDTEMTGLPEIPQELALRRGLAYVHMKTGPNDPLIQTLTAWVQVGKMEIDTVSARIERTQDLPSKDQALDTSEIARIGIVPQQLSLQLTLHNKSRMPGKVNLRLQVKKPDGTYEDLQAPTSFDLKPASVRGLTETSMIAIDERNSNLIDWITQGITGIRFSGQVKIDSGDAFVPITSDDEIGGSVALSLPLNVKFSPIGQDGRAPYDLPNPTKIDNATRQSLANLPAGSRVALTARVANGFRIPLVLNLLISAQDDPFADAGALVKSLALGDGSAVQESVLDFDVDALAALKVAKTVGVRLTSPGSSTPITLRSADRLSIQLMLAASLRPKALLDAQKK